ncbi:hypothetical protein [Bradyrhizobium sp. CW4]|uniref:hypothetical protein n=1 Tax=Bradyrhizobium sp. CW4 TaxID=2782687 RepID=UPI0031FCEB25
MKAIQSGIAVTASPTLWIVSASSAMLPENTTTTNCRTEVIANTTNDHFMAQMPFVVVAIVGSTVPWVWPRPLPSCAP